MEQPKKPVGGKDISDLKARLGLGNRPAPGLPPSMPASSPAVTPAPPPPRPPGPMPVAAPAAASAPSHNPYAAMQPAAGQTFDLRAVDDGMPAENVRAKGGKTGLIIGLLLVLVGGCVGFGFGAAAIGRRAYNTANAAARRVKSDLEDMQKTLTQVGVAVAGSQQRLAAAKLESLSFDPRLIEDLGKVKLDPRPDTSRIFKVDYYRLEDLAVDRLMNYYYDSIALYGEVERHVRKTKADAAALEAFSAKQAQAGATNYGLVFDQRGKITIGSLVEIGQPVCAGGGSGSDCPADKIDGFQIRANTGANWFTRKVGPKPEGDKLVPIDRTPLFEAVMSGSPDQVRNEQYKMRYNNIRLLLARLTAAQKELFEAVNRAAARADLFTM